MQHHLTGESNTAKEAHSASVTLATGEFSSATLEEIIPTRVLARPRVAVEILCLL